MARPIPLAAPGHYGSLSGQLLHVAPPLTLMDEVDGLGQFTYCAARYKLIDFFGFEA